MQLRAVLTSLALCAAALANNAQALPVTINLGSAYIDKLGADQGYTLDSLRFNAKASSLSLNYGQSVTFALSTFEFNVGNTGPNSLNRVQNFVLGRSIAINGAAGILNQGGSVRVGSMSDTLTLLATGPYVSDLSNGSDHYSVSLTMSGFSTSAGLGLNTYNAMGLVSLANIEDAPIAMLNGTGSFTFGDNLLLDASGSFDPDLNGGIATHSWDLDNDGIYERVGGSALELTKADYQSLFDNVTGVHTIGLKVTDNTGRSTTASFQTSLTALPAPAAEVPEPNSIALLLLGLSLLAASCARFGRKS